MEKIASKARPHNQDYETASLIRKNLDCDDCPADEGSIYRTCQFIEKKFQSQIANMLDEIHTNQEKCPMVRLQKMLRKGPLEDELESLELTDEQLNNLLTGVVQEMAFSTNVADAEKSFEFRAIKDVFIKNLLNAPRSNKKINKLSTFLQSHKKHGIMNNLGKIKMSEAEIADFLPIMMAGIKKASNDNEPLALNRVDTSLMNLYSLKNKIQNSEKNIRIFKSIGMNKIEVDNLSQEVTIEFKDDFINGKVDSDKINSFLNERLNQIKKDNDALKKKADKTTVIETDKIKMGPPTNTKPVETTQEVSAKNKKWGWKNLFKKD